MRARGEADEKASAGAPVRALVDKRPREALTGEGARGSSTRALEEDSVEEDLVFRGEGTLAEEQLKAFRADLRPPSLRRLADAWGVSGASLEALGVGFSGHGYTFPMRDAGGRVIGFRLRTWEEAEGTVGKYSLPGSRNGLFIPEGVTFGNVQLLCEGESDTAAALTLKFAAVGRPGAQEAIDLAVHFVSQRLNACPCVMGDNDEAGRKGTVRLAEALREAGVPCRILFPPEGVKDLREWLKKVRLSALVLAAAIKRKAVQYPARWPAGFTALPHALVRSGVIAGIGRTAWAVFSVIASFQDKDGAACPTREVIAELVGVSVATVDRCLTVLRKEGLLLWVPGRTGQANTYFPDFGPVKGLRKCPHRVRSALGHAGAKKKAKGGFDVRSTVERLTRCLTPAYMAAVERNLARRGHEAGDDDKRS